MSSLIHLGKKGILRGPKFKDAATSSLGEFYYNCTEAFADRICQIDASLEEDGEETYASVKQRSVRVALELQKREISSKDVVVLFTNVTLDTVVCILGCLYLGIKIANMDTSLSLRQISHLLNLVTPTLIFVDREYVFLVEEGTRSVNLNTDIIVFGQSSKYTTFDDFVKPQPKDDKFKPLELDIHDTIILFFGISAGVPRAVCHSHYTFFNTANILHEMGYTYDCVFHSGSFNRISSWILMTCCFATGGKRVFYRNVEAEIMFDIIQAFQVSHLTIPSIMSYELTKFKNRQDYDTSCLQFLILTGSSIVADQYHALNSLFINSSVISIYGLKELGIVTLFDLSKDKEFSQTRPTSSGRLAPGVTAKIVNSKGVALAPNIVGEICVKSKTMMKGYFKCDILETVDQDGFFRTGDVGYYDEDECFYILDRRSEVFKYLTHSIIPAPIEHILMTHPAVKEAHVFGVPSQDEGNVPGAHVVLNENFTITPEEIEQFVAAKVSDQCRLRGGVHFTEKITRNAGACKALTPELVKQQPSVSNNEKSATDYFT